MAFSGIRKICVPLCFGMLLGGSLSVTAAEYSASFKDTDIDEFVNTVGKNLNKTIIVEPSVRGKINVRSYDLFNERQYWQFFLNVLEVYGYAVVEMDNGIIKVIRSKDAKVAAIPVVDDAAPGSGDEMVTRVVPVRNVSVRELAPLLRQLNDNAGGGNVVNYDPSNVLMITGRAATVDRLVEIVRRVDKAGDQEVDIIRLKYASAAEMVRVVQAVTQSPATKGASSSMLTPNVVADERTNSVIVSGEPKARARLAALIRQLDAELETTGNTRVFYLKYAKAEELVKVLTGVSQSIESEAQGGGQAPARKTEMSIEADEDTNSLVITAQPDVMRTLEGVIRQLDIRRAQVLVEAIIVELADGDGVNLGVQWATRHGGVQFNDGSVIPLTQVAAGIFDLQGQEGTTTETIVDGNIVRTTTGDTDGDPSTLADVLSGLNGMMLGFYDGNFGAILSAAARDSQSNVLATPSLLTLDNQEAFFIVGEEVPTVTGSTVGSGNENPFTTVERRDVGIKLKVTPQINEGDAVQLTIEQEVSNVQGQTAVDVTFAKRQVQTTVLVDNNQTIVLGGLLDEQLNESVSKVPLLGDIPFLGALFRSTSTTKSKRNLMVFIRPTIIRDSATAAGLSSRKYSAIRAAQLLRQQKGIKLMPNQAVPVLPHYGEATDLPLDVREFLERARQKKEAGESGAR